MEQNQTRIELYFALFIVYLLEMNVNGFHHQYNYKLSNIKT